MWALRSLSPSSLATGELAELHFPGEDYTFTMTTISMHMARTAMNRDPKIREWAEQFIKSKERAGREGMSDEEFEKHWRYVKPERMHEGAIEAVSAYMQQQQAGQ